MKTTPPPNELPVILFETSAAFAAWLAENPTARGLWLRLAKKDSGLRSITYAEALEVALCYGWIDSQKKTFDASSWIQKFTPRGPKSIWSKVNTEKVEALIQAGRMQPAGLRAVESAKQDGRWAAAYAAFSKAEVPEDFQAALDQHPAAQAFFATLNQTNRYAILFRIQTAKKPETRTQRIEQLIAMLERNEKIHP